MKNLLGGLMGHKPEEAVGERSSNPVYMSEDLQVACFQIIAHAGVARSNYIMAVDYADKGEIDEAEKTIAEGEKEYIICHREHSKIVKLEEDGKLLDANLLLVHAEDQMMSAEAFKVMAEKFISLYKRLGDIPKETAS